MNWDQGDLSKHELMEMQQENLYLREELKKERYNKKRLEIALDSSKQGIWDWDLENETQYIDNRYAEMLGYSKEELEKAPVKWLEIIHPEDKEKVLEKVATYNGQVDDPFFQWELRFKDKSGQWRWILSRGRVTRTDKEGRPLRLVGTHLDIHQRKEIELKLKESEARFKNYIRNAPIGIFVANSSGVFIEVNEKSTDITGYSRDELVGMSIFDFFKDGVPSHLFQSFQNQDDLSEVHQIIKKDGTSQHIKVNAVKLAEDKFIGFVEDIEKRIQTEKQLERQKEYFQQLFDKSPDGIAILNNEGEIISVNQSFEEIFQLDFKDVEGRDINDIIVPETRKSEGVDLTRQVRNGQVFIGESVRQTKNGEKVHVLIYGYPITLEEDQLGIYAVYKNITERKREEEKVKFLSFHDQLTGLYNRRYFENEMERLNKSRELPISIIVADIDDLKNINDRFGHKVGDSYIKRAAEIIRQSTRDADIVARIGGDEFAVILPHTDQDIARDIKTRIVRGCHEENRDFNPGGDPDCSTCISVGFAVKKDSDEDLDEVFIEADNRMYRTKRKRKKQKEKSREENRQRKASGNQ